MPSFHRLLRSDVVGLRVPLRPLRLMGGVENHSQGPLALLSVKDRVHQHIGAARFATVRVE